jgi:hypothetical protein
MRLFILATLLLYLCSCQKGGNPPIISPEPVPKIQPEFKYEGDLLVLANIQFDTIQIPEGASLLWNFGDGSTSTDYRPIHKYFKRGLYKITLEVKTDTTYTITKNINIEIHPFRFAAARHWTGTDITGPLEAPYPPIVVNIEDTLLALNIHSDSTISFFTTPLMYHRYSPDTNILFFSAFGQVELTYDIKNDQFSFYFYQSWGAGQASGYREIKLKSK